MQVNSRKILFISISITLLTMAIVYYSLHTGREIGERYFPLVDAAVEIKLEVTTAHLWFEEVISGDRVVDIEDIWDHLDQSQWYAKAMLDGGANGKGIFIPLNDPKLRLQIEETIERIHHFRQIAQKRWASKSTSGIGSDIDQQFDLAFLKFNLSADNVKTTLQRAITEGLQKFKFTQRFLIALIFIFGVLIGGFLLRYNAKQIKNMLVLHKQEESTRIILNSIGDAVIATDTHSVVTFMNPVAIQLTGWASEKAIGQPLAEVFNIFDAHTLKPADNPVKKVMETGKTVGLANHAMLIAKDGTKYQIADSGAPTRSLTGDITGVVLVFRDVSDEYAQHAELEASQALIKKLINTVPDLIWLKDKNGVYLTCNSKFERMFGAQEHDIVGKTDYDFVDQNLADFFRKHDKKALIAGESTSNEELLTFADDGHTELVETIKTPMTDNNGNLIGILGISRDITNYKKSLEQLKQSESRLKEAQAQAKLGSWEQIFEDEKLTWSNEVYNIFEYDTNIALDYRQFVERIHPDDRREVSTSFQSSIEQRIPYYLEYRLLLPDGRIKYVISRAEHFYNNDNKHIRCLGTIQDITDNKEAEKLLIASDQRFKALVHQSPATIEIYNTKGFLTDMNDAAKKMWNLKKRPLYKFNLFASNEIKKKGHLKNLNKAYSGEIIDLPAHFFDTTDETRLGEGRKRWVTTTIFPLKDTNNIVQSIVISHVDITEQIHTEKKLHLSSRVFSDTHEGIIITDSQQLIVDVNPAFSQITGYSREEVIGKSPRILKSGRQSEKFYADIWQTLLKKGHWSGEMWNRRKNGEVYAERKTISAVRDEQGITTHYVALGSDVTQMKEHQDQLEHIAHYDLLTNLPNRSLLSDRLSQTMLQCNRHEQSLAVVFLDLDGFKQINDAFGHDVGDELLIALSLRMKEALRESDSLARIGGDEFVAVLADLAKIEDCKPVLDRLLLAASEPIIVGNILLHVSASIGVTIYPQDGADADILMRHADQAMYVAKESGKNRYHFFDTAQDNKIKMQRESLEAIRSALDTDQFVVYYQPKVNMRTGSVTGFEALIRWQHPERGLLNPIEFLPVIENNPMNIEMGEWVINTALRQISQWQKMGLSLPVNTSVNIAAVQLQQSDFTERLSMLLAAYPDVNPRYLELEVLETSALDDVQRVSKTMNACMALGVTFALDDFGTGYSSLTYLRRLPASLIKIDQSFVRDMLTDADDLAIVEGVIALAKSFKLNVIAEGVETIEHGTVLLQLGCELAQGFGIAKPMLASDIPAWVDDWKPDVNWQT
ncbi:MAG: diguanylate cyclase (GGDEF)-like protein/PAS domain S-box-containing protein [Paraglaciecola sp.]|jgi:diguanylate cyclase (GGDEF)-like protein/PAS domain S-box-containing protein